MKRHSSLRKLSDDHHGGLVRARRLRRSAAGEAYAATSAAVGAAHPEGQHDQGAVGRARTQE